MVELKSVLLGHLCMRVENALMCQQSFAAAVCVPPGKAPWSVTEGHCINVILYYLFFIIAPH